MAVLGRVLLNNSQRFDLTDAMSMDSYNLGDWKYYIKTLAGNVPYILKGFDIVDAPNRINKDSVTITVEDSIVYFPNSDTAPFFYGLPITSGISDPIEPTLKTNAVNHLYLTLTLAQGVSELKMFWDQYLSGGVGGEYSKMVDTETYVIAEIGSNTVNFPSGSIPIAKVTMDTSVIKSIQDCRPMFFRLGTGGYTPNPLNSYAWKSLPSSIYTRTETPSFINTSGGQNPFQGADKNIYSWKEWMDAMMSKIKEIDGGAFWYQPSTGSISSIFADVLKSTFRSKGTWEHDTSVPGKITWSEDIYITYWGSNLDLTIRAGNESLLDGQLLYIDLQRNKPANILGLRTEWFNGGTYVKGEAPGAFTDTKLGDYIKKDGEPDYYFCKIIGYRTATMVETPIPSLAVYADLQTAYNGSSETLVNAVYNRGIFSTSDLIVKDKNHDDINSAYGNLCWLAYRKDTIEDLLKIESFEVAGTATVISPTHSKIESVAHGLVDGDHIQIDIAAPGTVFVVDSATADSFTIFTDTTPISGAVNFYWATVETKERKVGTPPNDVVVESAEHNFEDGMSIEIKGTLNFDGTYLIKDKTTTTFNIASPVIAPAVENDTGTATMAVMHVRSESGVTKVLQGEVRYIGHSDTENIMKFIGQTEPSLVKPEYLVPDDFTGKFGEGNYGDTASADNLTNRASRLSAMMADKAQDKTIVIAPQDITNVTNLAGTLTFTSPVGTTPTLNIIIPSSRFPHTVDLSAGLVIGANQVAYVTIDRNQDAASILTPIIEDIELVPLEENIFILGYRLSTDTVWLWDGTEVEGTGMSVILKSADHLLNDTRFKAVPNSTPDDGILIYPSKRERQGKVLYSYILPNISSKFPRNTGTNEYDGGAYHDQTTLVRFGLVGSTITAEATWPDTTSTTVGTFTINDGEWIPVSVFVNADDSLSISYGSAQASLVDAKSDDNIPLGGSSQFKIACVVIHRDGTSIDNIDEDYILDRRAFGGGGGGSGDIDREDMIYISLLQNSIYTKTFYDKFDFLNIYIDSTNTTAIKELILDSDFYGDVAFKFIGGSSQILITKNIFSGNLTTYDEFYFHIEKDAGLILTYEYSVDGLNWYTFLPDVITYLPDPAPGAPINFTDPLYIKITESGGATGYVYNYGLFYSLSFVGVGVSTATRIKESTKLASSLTIDPLGTVFPVGTTYLSDGKSLNVYINGLKLTIGSDKDYIEEDSSNVRFFTNGLIAAGVLPNPLPSGTLIEFQENFGPYDNSGSIMPVIYGIQTDIFNLQQKVNFNRKLYVGTSPDPTWFSTIGLALLSVLDGDEIIVTENQSIFAQLNMDIGKIFSVKLKPGIKIIFTGISLADSVIKIGSNVNTENLHLELKNTGVVDCGYEFTGIGGNHQNMSLDMNDVNTTGSVTNAFIISAISEKITVEASIYESIGTINNVILDNSLYFNNNITIKA